MDTYPATFTDAHGSEETTIGNDGETLRMVIRGLQFAGSDFDSLEPAEGASSEQLAQFRLNLKFNVLCSYQIDCRIPISVCDHRDRTSGSLFVSVILGNPGPSGSLDREELRLTLACDRGRFSGPGESGWFEDELLEIQSRLPDGVYMEACINCLYSDYSPYGHGLFGCMMCFRNLKDEYLEVKSKDDFWSVHNRCDRMVQETFLCSEFKRRVPGTGYRG